MAICALQLHGCMLFHLSITQLYSSDPTVSQVWYTDDINVAGVGKYAALLKWWDILSQLGPLHAYILNTSKTYLVVKGK